ncbi:MAG: AAA+ family ATPase [Pseudomonadota bacterium]
MTRRRLIPIALSGLVLLATPAAAQTTTVDAPLDRDGRIDMDALKQEFDRVWDKMVEEVEPTLDRLGNTFDTLRQVDDLRNYEDPVILDNGDILIRRREDAPPLPPKDDGAEEVENPFGEGGTTL